MLLTPSLRPEPRVLLPFQTPVFPTPFLYTLATYVTVHTICPTQRISSVSVELRAALLSPTR